MDFKKNLDLHGYVVIPDVLTPGEVLHYRHLFESWRESVPDLDNHHEQFSSYGIYQYHQVGHQRFAWEIRTNEKVQQPFKDIWGTDDLVVSFDGACYMSKNLREKDSIWTHTDQAPKKKHKSCVQGFVSLTDNKERTLVVYEGSHLLHRKYFEDRGECCADCVGLCGLNGGPDCNNDWQRINHEYLDEIRERRRVLEVPAGSLVLWDSRTFHQSQYGSLPEERLIQYVCYLPKNDPKNTIAMREKRMTYFNTFRTTAHWPYPICVKSLHGYATNNSKNLIIDYSKLPPIDLDDLRPKINMLL